MSEPHQKSKIADLRSWYLNRLSKTARWFIAHLDNEEISRPTTLQEIPALAKEMLKFMKYPEPTDSYMTTKGVEKTYIEANPAREIVQMSLEVAKELKLLESGMDLPLRRIWYAFIKAALERGLAGFVYTQASEVKKGEQREPEAEDYYSGFGNIIKTSDLWYKDYGIKNTGKLTFVPITQEGYTDPTIGDIFTPIMIGVEKASYFEVLKNMCKMLGLSLYASGGQSSISATEEIMKRIDPIMKSKGDKHMDIYAITDFDPAGYSIAKGIHNHSKLFIERFGNTVDFERLAPLPKHYTDIELEQGLYTVKKQWTEPTSHTFKKGIKKGETETKGHWGYNPDRDNELGDGIKLKAIEVIEEREAEGEIEFERKRVEYASKSKAGAKNPHEKGDPVLDKYGDEQFYISQGLEIESLPEEPLEELLNNPPSVMPYSFKGVARMRFIIFDDLIERHGLQQAFKFLISLKKRDWSTYTGTSLADKVVNVQNVKKIDDVVQQADNPFWQLHTDIEEWIKEYISEEKQTVAADIDEWLDDVIEQYTNPNHEDYDSEITEELKTKLKDKIYKALASNENSISFDFPEKFKIEKVLDSDQNYYEEDFEITIPDEIVNNIKPIADFSKCIALNAQEAVDYLEELQQDLDEGEHIFDREWDIPPVRACEINDDGEAEFIEGEIIQADCDKYRTQIRKLHDQIADLEWEYEKDIMELEKQIEDAPESGDPEEINRLKSLLESRMDRIEDWQDRYTELKKTLEDAEANYAEKSKQLQEAHTISLDYVKTAEEKIKELEKEIKAQVAKPKPEPEPPTDDEKSAIEQYAEAKELKQKKKEEKEAEVLANDPFRYWEENEINHPKLYKKRIQLYYSHTKTMPKAIRTIIDEKLGTMEKIYSKNYPKIEEAVGQEYTEQFNLLSGDLNRLNLDIKKLFRYGR